jgi:hypothetical protein
MRYLPNSRNRVLSLGGALLLIGCQQQSTTQQAKAPSAKGAGVMQNVRQAVKRAADMEDLKNFALAYFQYAALNGRGPGGVRDISDSLPRKMIGALHDDSVYVVIWNVRSTSTETVIAYAAEPDSYGKRLVARGDGSVTSMNQEEFEKVKPRR